MKQSEKKSAAKAAKVEKKTSAKEEQIKAKSAKKAEPDKKAQPAKKAEPVKAAKPAKKAEPKKSVKEAPAQKEATKKAAPAAEEKDSAKIYHISFRKEENRWQVKRGKADKALKLFNTQEEAIAYAREVADNQEGHIVIHKLDGKMRKQRY